jgi:phospholipid-translocating ATPase
MTLSLPSGQTIFYDILAIFPFTSESKRMGAVVKSRQSGEITFVQKGADTIMSTLVQKNDWLDEECGNMAREGLRTLVVARKKLSGDTWETFDREYRRAQVGGATPEERSKAISKVIGQYLENDLELLALTGVEDKLQEDVKPTLELMRNAGIKIWMLTGDKIETATNIAVSSKLVARGQYIHQVAKCKLNRSGEDRADKLVKRSQQIRDVLDFLRAKTDACLVIDGESLQVSWQVSTGENIAHLLALLRSLPYRICYPRHTTPSCSGLSLLTYAESRCCEVDQRIH